MIWMTSLRKAISASVLLDFAIGLIEANSMRVRIDSARALTATSLYSGAVLGISSVHLQVTPPASSSSALRLCCRLLRSFYHDSLVPNPHKRLDDDRVFRLIKTHFHASLRELMDSKVSKMPEVINHDLHGGCVMYTCSRDLSCTSCWASSSLSLQRGIDCTVELKTSGWNLARL